MNKVQKVAISAGLALALTVGFGTTAKSAWAGYLGAQTQVSAGTPGSFGVAYTTTGGSFTQSYTNASQFGNTIPNPLPASSSGPITSIASGGNFDPIPNNALFYSSAGLDLLPVASLTQNYSASSSNGTIAGQVLSQVFKVGPTATMANANPGELVFTYQFDVTSVTPQPGSTQLPGVNQLTLAYLNNPISVGNWLLGGGFNSTTAGDPSGYTAIGNSLSGTLNTSDVFSPSLAGQITVDPNNGTIVQELDTWGSSQSSGVAPQIFLATNAYSYSVGSLGVQGSGFGSFVNTFVPGTPEPSTLVLLGSGLALLAFMALRRKENGLTI
jgi:hypothetical protein